MVIRLSNVTITSGTDSHLNFIINLFIIENYNKNKRPSLHGVAHFAFASACASVHCHTSRAATTPLVNPQPSLWYGEDTVRVHVYIGMNLNSDLYSWAVAWVCKHLCLWYVNARFVAGEHEGELLRAVQSSIPSVRNHFPVWRCRSGNATMSISRECDVVETAMWTLWIVQIVKKRKNEKSR